MRFRIQIDFCIIVLIISKKNDLFPTFINYLHMKYNNLVILFGFLFCSAHYNYVHSLEELTSYASFAHFKMFFSCESTDQRPGSVKT